MVEVTLVEHHKMSLATLLKERKKRKLSRKFGISTDALLRAHRPRIPEPLPKSAKVDFEIAIRQFTESCDLSPPQGHTNQWLQTSEPEPAEVQVETSFCRPKSLHLTPKTPIENAFFQLPSPCKVTDEQLYEEFKRDFIARGIENAFRRERRRNLKRGRRSRSAQRQK
jgi:hypothetical protein